MDVGGACVAADVGVGRDKVGDGGVGVGVCVLAVVVAVETGVAVKGKEVVLVQAINARRSAISGDGNFIDLVLML